MKEGIVEVGIGGNKVIYLGVGQAGNNQIILLLSPLVPPKIDWFLCVKY